MPHDAEGRGDHPAVIAVAGRGEADEGRQLAELLRFLKRRGVIAGYDQAALLLHSVREQAARPYLDALEQGGVPVRRVSAGQDGGGPHRRHRPALTVTTIHQAKGREWDVVIVGSLGFSNPDADPVGRELLPYLYRSLPEPQDRVGDFDHARQHYVAFSRARRLLALTAAGQVHPRFQDAWERLPRWSVLDRRMLAALGNQRFNAPGPDRFAAVDGSARAPQVIPHARRLDIRLGGGSIHR